MGWEMGHVKEGEIARCRHERTASTSKAGEVVRCQRPWLDQAVPVDWRGGLANKVVTRTSTLRSLSVHNRCRCRCAASMAKSCTLHRLCLPWVHCGAMPTWPACAAIACLGWIGFARGRARGGRHRWTVGDTGVERFCSFIQAHVTRGILVNVCQNLQGLTKITNRIDRSVILGTKFTHSVK